MGESGSKRISMSKRGFWLVAGGVVYSAGIYFYLNDSKVRHYHGIWHLFVLGASLCHFLCFLLYVA